VPWQGCDQSALVTLPPLGAIWLGRDAVDSAGLRARGPDAGRSNGPETATIDER